MVATKESSITDINDLVARISKLEDIALTFALGKMGSMEFYNKISQYQNEYNIKRFAIIKE
jgi:hypothetical protein